MDDNQWTKLLLVVVMVFSVLSLGVSIYTAKQLDAVRQSQEMHPTQPEVAPIPPKEDEPERLPPEIIVPPNDPTPPNNRPRIKPPDRRGGG